ncbi:MAG: hypothetical protein JNM27_20990 [Leptospirales bacterium]|nr:hypothetical protein [Leptospirales bacterium]
MQSTRSFVTLLTFILIVILSCPGTLQAQPGPHSNWSDLDSHESRVYGSEKEKKFPINAFFFEKEDWQDHYAWHVFWLFRKTDYPKYQSSGALPFYYHLQSKIDNRERTIIFPFFLQQKDADTKYSISPVTLFDDTESTWFHLYGWLFLRRGQKDFTHTALLPLIFLGSGDNSEYHAVAPLYYYDSTVENQSATRTLITPLLFSRGSESDRESSSFSISPLHFYSSSKTLTSHTNNARTANDRKARNSADPIEEGNLGFPVLPFAYYSSWSGNANHHRVMSILNWDATEDGLAKFSLLPLVFYGEDYLVFAPAFFRFGKTDDRFLFGPLYYVNDDPQSSDRLVFPVWWSSRKDRPSDTLHILPLYFSWNDRTGDRERDTRLSPGLFYWNSEPDSSHLNILGLFDLREKKEQTSLAVLPVFFSGSDYLVAAPFFFRFGTPEDRLTFGPLYYFGEDAKSTSNFIFPAIWTSRKDGKGESFYALPVYFSWRSRTDEREEVTRLSPGLFYWNNDSRTTHLNVLGLFNLTGSEKGESSFFLLPLIFSGKDYLVTAPFYFGFGEPGDRLTFGPLYYFREDARSRDSFVFPVWWSARRDDSADAFHILPVYFSWNNRRTSAEETTKVSPGLFYWNREDSGSHLNLLGFVDITSGKEEAHTWVLPFMYSGQNYLHVVPFLISSWKLNEKGEIADTTKVGPIYFWHTNDSERERLVGPVWWSANVDDKKSSFHVLPVTFYWRDSSKDKDLARSSLAINLLFFHSQDYGSLTDKLEFADVFWAPIIPLYVSYQTETSARRNLLLANWSNDVTGLNQLWIIPFYFWRQGKAGGYLYVPPFYFRPSGPNVDEGYSLGLAHYHSWSREHDRLWLLLLYRDIQVEAQYMHVLPLYYSWHTQESTGQLTFPIWMDYEDKTKSYSVNIAGISSSRVTGVVGSSMGSREGRWYLDTEVSWLYNAFSFSARVSTPEKEKQKPEPTLADLKDPQIREIAEREQKTSALKSPTLSRKLVVSRDETFYYWGFSALYGVLSYQHADTRRHFRLLPFAWLSWSVESDDRVTLIPGAYLNYHYEETDYFALFPAFVPIYGKQRTGKSYVEAYGVFLGINEYDDDAKRSELSVLWPVANFYSSPEQEGSRILPVYWNRLTRTGEETEKRTVSLVHYRSSRETRKENETFWAVPLIVPLFLHSDVKQGSSEATWTTLIPLYYYQVNKDEKSHTDDFQLVALPGIYYASSMREKDGKKTGSSTTFVMGYYATESLDEANTNVLLGLYKSQRTPKETYHQLAWGLLARQSDEQETSRWLIPFHYSRETRLADQESSLFVLALPFVYRSSDTGKKASEFHTNVMFLADWASNENGLKRAWFLPLFAWKKNSYTYAFPYYASTSDEETSTYLFPVAFSWNDKERWTGFYAGLYLYSSESYSRQNFLYLADHVRNGQTHSYDALLGSVSLTSGPDETRFRFLYGLAASESNQHESKRWLLPLHYARTSTTEEGESSTFFLALPFVYRTTFTGKTTSQYDTNFMFLADWESNQDGFKRFWALPVYAWRPGADGYLYAFPYYSARAGDETSMHILPLAYSWRDAKQWTAFVAGLYLHSSPSGSRQNFLYLVDHKGSAESDSYRAMLGTLNFTTGSDLTSFELAYGLLLNARSQAKEFDLDYALFLGGVEKKSNYLHHRLLPAYWYESSDRMTFLVSPLAYYNNNLDTDTFRTMIPLAPLVWYQSESGQDVRQLGLLGTAWFRDYDSEERTARSMLLLGTLYNDVQKPERSYRSRGSFWGLLWDYETESNGFSKLSVLKFVYTRTSDEDGTRTRIMGVTI